MDRYASLSYKHPNPEENQADVDDREDDSPNNSHANTRSCLDDDDDDEEVTGPVVEITLQCLRGIQCRSRQRMSVSAQVSFSGSAQDMQVGSSMLCGRTGQLVVESQTSILESMDEEGAVYWKRPSPSRTPVVPRQPHLTIRLPQYQDPRLPSIPLSKVNRDSRLVNQTKGDDDWNAVPSLQDESDASSRSVDPPGSATAEKDDGTVRGGSIVWSASGAAMPEIVELHVTLLAECEEEGEGVIKDRAPDKEDEDEDIASAACLPLSPQQQQQGICHLVFYGNDHGTFVLDLPVKKLNPSSSSPRASPLLSSPHSSSSSSSKSMIWMDANAYLRVSVSVSAMGGQQQRRRIRQEDLMRMNNSSSWVNHRMENDNHDRWATIIQQLHQNEEQARRLRQTKLVHDDGDANVEHKIVWDDDDDEDGLLEPHIPRLFTSRAPPPSGLFCAAATPMGGSPNSGGPASRWMDAMVESFSRVASCQYPKRSTTPFPTMVVSRRHAATNHKMMMKPHYPTTPTTVLSGGDKYEWSISHSDTMVSTIATRESLDLL
jgi:hypothetical protein